MADQLAESGVASISLHPDLVRTEGVMQFAEHLDLTASQSPKSIGRVIAKLADDPDVTALSGQAWRLDNLARRYHIDATAN